MAFKFKDNAGSPIIAIDFDGCITQDNEFPKCGEPRRYAKEVINLLRRLGTKVVIWSCREHEDKQAAIEWLNDHGIGFDAFNSSIEFAPWDYEAQKIYAHMYVDDKGYGWRDDYPDILLDVMDEFMERYMKVCLFDRGIILRKMIDGEEITDKWIEENI